MSGGNRVLIRLARRSITKAPLRSLLIVLLITVVVSVGTAVAIAMRSATPTNADRFAALYGSADVVVSVGPGTLSEVPFEGQPLFINGAVFEPGSPTYNAVRDQAIEQQQGALGWLEERGNQLDPESIETAVQAPALVSRIAQLGPTGGPFSSFRTFDPFQNGGELTDIDMTNPLAQGLLVLVEGRFPAASDEIAVTQTSNNTDTVAIGSTISQRENSFTVVGIVTSPSDRYRRMTLVTPEAFDTLSVRSETLRFQIHLGQSLIPDVPLMHDELVATLRDTIDWPYEAGIMARSNAGGEERTEPAIRIVPALISAVLGIQMALVAATAFAVGVRRRTKEFGQLITTGMDGRQLQRMVLLEAALLGLIGAIVGVAVGVLAISQVISWGWISEIGQRYVTSPRWNVVDWLAPAMIGVLAAIAAAWWPARSLVKAPVTSALAGHLPAGRPRTSNPRWGLLVVVLGSLAVAGLAASTSSDQGSLSFIVVFVAAVTTTFVGTLFFIGSILTGVNHRSSRFPLLARLVVRSSDRHRTRSWMVVGAFMATLAIPVLVGASIKAYPDSYRLGAESDLDRRLVSVLSEEPQLDPEQRERIPVDLPAEVALFVDELDAVLTDEFGAMASAPVNQLAGASLSVERDGMGSGSGVGISVISPELAALLEVPDELASQVEGSTVLYLGSERLRDLDISTTFLDQWGERGRTERISVDVIDGPELSNYQNELLVSPELADQLEQSNSRTGRLYSFAEPIDIAEEEAFFTRANELWVERFGLFDMPTGATVPSDSALIQDWVVRQTSIQLQQNYQSGPPFSHLQWWSLAATGVLAALIALITASLAAVELDGEMQSMVATGAAPVMRRLMLGAQTLYHLVLAAVLAIPLALLLFYAVSRADNNGPDGITVPWGSMGLTAIVIPIVVGGLVTLTFRNGRPAVSRRLS